jgi:hypothetical protein
MTLHPSSRDIRPCCRKYLRRRCAIFTNYREEIRSAVLVLYSTFLIRYFIHVQRYNRFIVLLSHRASNTRKRTSEYSKPSNFLCNAVLHKNRKTLLLENISLYLELQQVFQLVTLGYTNRQTPSRCSLTSPSSRALFPHHFWMWLYSITMFLQRPYTIKPATGS